VRAVAISQVASVSDVVEVPVIGMGGIASGRDALDFIAAGASAIAVGTESFRDPAAGDRIRTELAREVEQRGLHSVDDARRSFGQSEPAGSSSR
jgi:dihydroorotate dehydrogenase (NAD+) catalytic subunit